MQAESDQSEVAAVTTSNTIASGTVEECPQPPIYYKLFSSSNCSIAPPKLPLGENLVKWSLAQQYDGAIAPLLLSEVSIDLNLAQNDYKNQLMMLVNTKFV